MMTGSKWPAAEEDVNWDVVEEHLDEAEWEVEQFESALDDPDFTLEELMAGPEARLRVHVHGLALGERAVVDRLLVPELQKAKTRTARAEAIAMALARQGECGLALECFGQLDQRVKRGALRGIALATDPKFDTWLLKQLDPKKPLHSNMALEVIGHRGLRVETLIPFLDSDDVGQVLVALLACPWAKRETHCETVDVFLRHEDPSIREAAMVAGLHFASRRAWSYCRKRALENSEPQPLATMIVVGLDSTLESSVMTKRLSVDQVRPVAIRALGYAGDPAAIPQLIELTEERGTLQARLAAEAIATIAGLDAEAYTEADGKMSQSPAGDGPELPPLEEDLDADLLESPEDRLPNPDPARLRSWWCSASSTFVAGRRYLAGEPRSLPAILRALQRFPLRRRHPLGLVLSIRSAGKLRVDTRAFGSIQRRQLERVSNFLASAPAEVLAPF